METQTTETPVQVQPPPTFGDLEAKSNPNPGSEPINLNPEPKATVIDPTPDPAAATAAQPDPAKPAEPAKVEGDKKPEAEAKPDGEKPAPKEPEKTEKTEVPEKYDLKLSENSLLNQAALDRIAASAKVQGLSQEAAQELVKAQEGEVATAMSAAIESRKESLLKECLADKEIGGNETKLKESIVLASSMLDKYGDAQLRKELTATGFGNHPGLVKMLVKIGKASANDKSILPKTTSTSPQKSIADVMYDNPKSVNKP